MIRQRLVAGLATATALVALAACGSDTPSSTRPAATQAAAVTVAAERAAAATIPGVSVPDISVPDVSVPDMSVPGVSVPDVSIPDVSIPELTGKCLELQQQLPDMSNATNFDTADVEKAFTTLRSEVPADLKDDVTTIKTTLQPFYDAVAKAGGDATKAMQDPQVVKQIQTSFTDPDFTASMTALQGWFEQGCRS